jgi:hypothetical protein
MLITFLFKVRTLKARNGDITTIITVFDPITAIVRSHKVLSSMDETYIHYYLMALEDYKYKNFTIEFKNEKTLRF